jgi:RNA-directed DNA polymerase
MEKEMKELYIEGVATHGGPESCVGAREDVGEALTGVRAGWLSSREITEAGVPTQSMEAEGHTVGGAIREPLADPARSKNPCMRGISMCENREVPRSPDRVITGRAAPGRLRPKS